MKCSCMSIALLLLVGCADIRPKPGQTVEEFCEDWATMRPWSYEPGMKPHGYAYWYRDCLIREYRRKEEDAPATKKDPPLPEW